MAICAIGLFYIIKEKVLRSYRNNEGELTTVTEDHLETAVKIKIELQNASPSRSCSWKIHKELMEKEGYYDSSSNEPYRQMIKSYQKGLGTLPSATKHAELVTQSKLESIKEYVGEISYAKRENQNVLRELNKAKREIMDRALLIEEIARAYKDYDYGRFKFNSKPIDTSNASKKMVVILTDLHIGAKVENVLNTYNYEVAKVRLQNYLNKLLTEITINNVKEVLVANLGDVVEHAYMRHNQGHDIEFPLSMQMVKASDIILSFLSDLSKVVKVSYAGIGGNHDRLSDKDRTIDGDHVVRVINDSIMKGIDDELNLEYIQADDYEFITEVNGVKIKFVHGDLDNLNNFDALSKNSDIDNTNYNIIAGGHLHHFMVREVGIDKAVAMFGSTKGTDGYGKKIKKVSKPSQGIILIDDEGNFEIKRIEV